METFEVNILGCGSAMPTTRHFPTSQVVNLRNKLYMIDCGEGAQLQMRRLRLSFNRLNHIFISHLHGDHCFGLPGLISTFDLMGRTAELHIYAPKGLSDFLTPILSFSRQHQSYPVTLHELDPTHPEQIFEDASMSVHTIPLHHRVPCCGFRLEEKPQSPHILRDVIDFYRIPLCYIPRIKEGADWVLPDGTVVPNSRLTRPAAPPRSYVYCSDTLYRPQIAPLIGRADLLFHEATFTETEADMARKTGHSTARQAAQLARDCGAQRLCIGHFSARYNDEQVLLDEAQAIFPQTVLAKEGGKLTL